MKLRQVVNFFYGTELPANSISPTFILTIKFLLLSYLQVSSARVEAADDDDTIDEPPKIQQGNRRRLAVSAEVLFFAEFCY